MASNYIAELRLDRVCIANHLKIVLPALINRGFIPNISIGDTIRVI